MARWLIVLGTLLLGLLGSSPAEAKPKKKIIVMPSETVDYCEDDKPHYGDIWVEDFYESTVANGSSRYTVQVCWQPYYVSKALCCPTCVPHPKPKVLPKPETAARVKVEIWSSLAEAPKYNYEGPIQFDVSLEAKTPYHLTCKTVSTQPFGFAKSPEHGAWVRVEHEEGNGMNKQESNEDNNTRRSRPDLSVTPDSYQVVMVEGVRKLRQTLTLCSGAADVDSVKLAFSLDNSVRAKKPGAFSYGTTVKDIPARNCKTTTLDLPTTKTGMFTGFVLLDPTAKHEEVDEGNNLGTFWYSIGKTVTAHTPKPIGEGGKGSVGGSGGSSKGDEIPESPSQGQGGVGTPPAGSGSHKGHPPAKRGKRSRRR